MKHRRIIKLVICIAVCAYIGVIYLHNEHAKSQVVDDRYPVTEPFQYPSKEDIPNWNSYTLDEKMAILDLPDGLAETMTTDALVSSVLSYPYIINIAAFTDLRFDFPKLRGVLSIRDNNKAMAELLTREDATDVLQKRLDDANAESIEYYDRETLQYYYIKIIIGYLEYKETH